MAIPINLLLSIDSEKIICKTGALAIARKDEIIFYNGVK